MEISPHNLQDFNGSAASILVPLDPHASTGQSCVMRHNIRQVVLLLWLINISFALFMCIREACVRSKIHTEMNNMVINATIMGLKNLIGRM